MSPICPTTLQPYLLKTDQIRKGHKKSHQDTVIPNNFCYTKPILQPELSNEGKVTQESNYYNSITTVFSPHFWDDSMGWVSIIINL